MMKKCFLFCILLHQLLIAQRLELPLSSNFSFHSGYFFEYSPQHKQSKWVAYMLKGEDVKKNTLPETQFYDDLKLPDGAINSKDFVQRVFVPGQLKPSADARACRIEMHDTYYYANVSPMHTTFDQETWRILENAVRGWAVIFDSIYVISGPVFSKKPDTVGVHKIPVPDYFFKAILVYNGIDMQAIGYVLPNIDIRREYIKTPVTVDSLERLTGMNLFYQLPDYIQNDVESSVSSSFWMGGSNSFMLKAAYSSGETQCIATTVMDKRCVLLTKCLNACCSLHGCEGD